MSGAPSDDPRHSHIVSLSTFLDDGPNDDNILGEVSTLIKPDGYRTEDFPEAFKIHGITTERAMAEGISLTLAMDQVIAFGRHATSFVAYSAFFDFKLLKIACARIPNGDAMRQELEKLSSICTMEAAAQHLIGKRRMKLKDAYFELFHEQTQTDKHHGSRPDALASRRIFWELKRLNALPEAKSLERKVYDTPPPPRPSAGIDGGAPPLRKRPGAL